ncbi:MAG: glycosyltransferase family 39 protein [Thermoflexales bacterium]|nr:glycosyltransferase family 39 protein [Thermoflexales bacterium]
MKSPRPRWEWPLVIALVLLAFFMRVWQLNEVPPGLHHDEVIIGQVAKDILRGNFAIYFTAGYGHEPLYHYLVAGFFAALGASAFALRLTSAFLAVLGLVVAYRLTRRLFSPVVAVGMLVWLSISLWPVFFARVGLRGITLPLLTTLTAYFLWKALHASRSTYYVLAGALLGLTLYTYQASRVFPVIFAVFFVYLAVTRSSLVTRYSSLISRVGMFFIIALLVAAPLIVYLTVINPTAEERVADLSGPLNQLRDGDPSEVIQSTLNTLGMFTITGDAVPIYNVGGRPVFPEPIGAALFYLGLLMCVWRWKQPAYAFMLIWFVISLAPAMVTPFSPNFVRTMAAWPVPFVFVGLGVQSIGQLVNRLISQLVTWPRRHLVILSSCHLVVFVLAFGYNAVLTYRDYFLDWPRGDYVRFWQQATWTQAVRAINAEPSSTPVTASGLSIQDFDPQTFDLLGVRSDVKAKWFDCRNAMLYPAGDVARYLEPDFLPCDADLMARFLPDTLIAVQPRWPDSGNVIFTLRSLDLKAARPTGTLRPAWIGGESFAGQAPQTDLTPVALPVDFEGLHFKGWEADRIDAQAGIAWDMFTHWALSKSIAPPLKIFIHVTAPDGKIVAQWDGLDVNVGTLAADDVFIQRHRLDLPPDLSPGEYRVSLGIYRPDTGARLAARMVERSVDLIVVGTLAVK